MSTAGHSGSITIITGCMYAEKTTELLRMMNRHKFVGRKILLIKPTSDTRSGIYISSHPNFEGQKMFSEAVEIKQFSEIREESLFLADVIGIDEGNFYEEDIVDFCEKWANEGKIVIVAGLNGTFKREHFGFLHLLYPKAEYHIHLSAICMICKKDGAFTHRKTDEVCDFVVGGSNIYVSLCRDCFNRAQKKVV